MYRRFEKLALELLNACFQEDAYRARFLLTRPIDDFGGANSSNELFETFSK